MVGLRPIARVLVGAALGVDLLAPEASARPWFAQKDGVRCSQCHVNGTGGGMRTGYGRQWSWTELSVVDPGGDPLDADEGGQSQRVWGAIDPTLNDQIAVGANLRGGYRAILADETRNSFTQPEANVYVALDALRVATAYVDVGVAEGAVEAREAFLMLHRLGGLRLKAGIILLPYGLRFWDDRSFARTETGFTYADSDLGVEVGYELGGFGAFVAATNGTGGGLDDDEDKKLTGTVEYVHRWFRVGASGTLNRNARQEDLFGGMHLGLSLGRFFLLGQADLLRSSFLEEDVVLEGFVAHAEINALVLRGLNLKAVYGYHDPALSISDNDRVRLRAGFELYPVPMVAVSAFYDLRQSVPQDEVGNADVVEIELHLYL